MDDHVRPDACGDVSSEITSSSRNFLTDSMDRTYNGAFIISILLGLGTGEVLFGRIAPTGVTH
jgi:hypothetical protein